VSTEKPSAKHTAIGRAAKLNEQRLMKFSLPGQIESNYDETVDSFDTMNLKPELLRGTIHSIHCGESSF